MRAIGLRTGRAKGTVSAELRRLGPGVVYEAAAAQTQAAALAGVARRLETLKITGEAALQTSSAGAPKTAREGACAPLFSNNFESEVE